MPATGKGPMYKVRYLSYMYLSHLPTYPTPLTALRIDTREAIPS
jgi:hypothetical protein